MSSILPFLSHRSLYKPDTSSLVDHSAKAIDIRNEKDENSKEKQPIRVTIAAFCQNCRVVELSYLLGPLKGSYLTISLKEKIEDPIVGKIPLLFHFVWS